MTDKVYVQESGSRYMATLHDECGEVGFPVFADTEIDAVFKLGAAYGRAPAKFARPLGDLLREGE